MSAGEPRLVLLVDDDAGTQDVVTLALEEEGYQVLQAAEGTGLERALAAQPTLILLDIHMPHLDAVALSQRLKTDPTTRPIPLIAFTAVPRQQVDAALVVDDWLAKPFDLDALWACVARWALRAKEGGPV